MADVQKLLAAFIAEDRGPAPADPLPYLAQVDGASRTELELLIDAYLARAPRRPVAPEALRAHRASAMPSAAETLAERIEQSFAGVSGEWPVLLPRLRDAARLTRRALVTALARQLEIEDETDRVAWYYHQMERGLLPAEGVSDRVLAALGELLGQRAEQLRRAGRALAPSPRGPLVEPRVAFARTTTPDAELANPDPGTRVAPSPVRGRADALFTGGAHGGGQR